MSEGLIILAVFIFSLVVTLAPVIYFRSWEGPSVEKIIYFTKENKKETFKWSPKYPYIPWEGMDDDEEEDW